MTTLASIVVRDSLVNRPAASIAGRLFYDTTNSELQRDNGSSWDAIEGAGAAETLPESIIDAVGDLIVGDGADSAVRKARGTDGQALVSTATDIAWEDQFYTVNYMIYGGGDPVPVGAYPAFEAPMAGVIVRSRALLDQAATLTADWWKDTYANYQPANADSITASAPVSTSAAIKAEDSTLTGWTTAISAGDILMPNIDANDLAEWVTLVLRIRKT